MTQSSRFCTQPECARSREAGFTLIEMLVVIAIIGLLVGLVGPRVFNLLAESKVRTAQIQIDGFKNSLDLYFLDNGRYPTTAEGLNALEARPAGERNWNGPYLKGDVVPKDPWGHSYLYRSPGPNGKPYEIISNGPRGPGADHGQITSQ